MNNILTPFINKNRFDLKNRGGEPRGGVFIVVSGNYKFGYLDQNNNYIFSLIEYGTMEEVKQALDQKLIEAGYTLLTPEQYEKLQILI